MTPISFEFKHNGLVGFTNPGELPFLMTDSEELFIANSATKPREWKYYTAKVSYILNSLGHRSPELSSIMNNDYVLFCGDSRTFGLGVSITDSFAYKVSSRLDLPYYNLGIPAAGLDLQMYNLTTFLNLMPTPKYIVFYEPFPDRFFMPVASRVEMHGPWSPNANYKHAVTYSITQSLTATCKSTLMLLKKMLPQTIVHVEYMNPRMPKARDDMHDGTEGHDVVVEQILSQVK